MPLRQISWMLALMLSLFVARVGAQPSPGTSSGETVYTIARDLMCSCPSCAGKALDQCEPGCHDGQKLRDEVAGMMREGKSREQILKAMAAAHGPVILGAPPSEGWGVLSIAIPFACLALGSLPLLRMARGRKASKPKRAPRATNPPAAEDARVEAALKDYDF